ncbi:MAG: dehydratase [Beijerinckiaceae bacterium]|jgi:acyl dehydratase|nr:dehydratase [Beijerinckiaceae bacterium]
MRFFEDFRVGEQHGYGSVAVSEAEILRFARQYDAQPMHTDSASQQAQMTGGLIASGWHTASLNMRLMADNFLLTAKQGLGSPGVSRLDWVAPVRPGDTLSGRFEVLGKKASASKPDRGFVNFRFTLVNQHGTDVLRQDNLIMFARRDASAPVPPPEGTEIPPPAPESLGFTDAPNPAMARIGAMQPGLTLRFGEIEFTPEAIKAFARDYDPQEFHLDEDIGRATHFGGLSASGWQIASNWMRAIVRFWESEAAAGRFVPKLGPSPGFRDLLWLRPVLAGDRITYGSRFIEGRKSASKPGWGIAQHRNFGINQRGQLVFAFTGIVLWEAEA